MSVHPFVLLLSAGSMPRFVLRFRVVLVLGLVFCICTPPRPVAGRSAGLARFVFESSSLLALVAAAPAGVIAAGAPLVRRCAAGVLAGLGAGRGR
jgi:hypothetical protein